MVCGCGAWLRIVERLNTDWETYGCSGCGGCKVAENPYVLTDIAMVLKRRRETGGGGGNLPFSLSCSYPVAVFQSLTSLFQFDCRL